MGPKVKKAPKNAFTLFAEGYIASQREQGRVISMKVAIAECGPLWKDLPEEVKQHYGQMAAAYKTYSKEDKHNKFTSTGISYAELERQEEELRKKNESADAEIKMTISNLDAELLKTQLFYIVHCNYYCKTNKGVYVPGEIAISEFNLEEGVRRTFHRLINPGCIPFGYAYEATETIKEIHGLPYPPYEEGDSDYAGIRDLILKFLEPGKLHDGRYPPLYTIENNLKASEYILSAFDSTVEEDNSFRVYLLHKMFFWLKNKCVENNDDENVGFPVMSNAEGELIKDVFRYAPGISCSFHLSSEDKYQNCSLSFVQRFSFVICDHCCQHIGIDLIPGKHCRPNADLEGGSRFGGSSVKSRPSPPMSVAGDSEYDGRSSYGGNQSSFNWKKENPGSFLHEELESKLSAFEVSSIVSKSSYDPLHRVAARGPRPSTSSRRSEAEENSSDEENLEKVVSLGRGKSRR